MESTSVTIRIPNDLLEKVDLAVEHLGGGRKRTEVVVNLLRKAMGEENYREIGIGERPESNTEIEKLREQVTQSLATQESILQRLATVENRITTAILKKASQKAVSSQPQQKPETKPEPSPQLDLISEERNQDLEKTEREVTGQELLQLLRQHAPDQRWDAQKIRGYRLYKEYKGQWQQKGSLRFTYLRENPKAKKSARDRHIWAVKIPR